MTHDFKAPVFKQTINHDNMSLDAKFPSGATFRWYISRAGERLTYAFSNDSKISNAQGKILNQYLKSLKGSNKERFDAVQLMMEGCFSGSQVIEKIINLLK